jgi:branched-chain amino acid transport system ATP-binding protein
MSVALPPLLEADGISAGYGDLQVLWNVSLTVERRNISVLLGRNGAGKTTTLRAIAGLNRITRGKLRLRGEDVTSVPTHARVRRGIAMVQEGKRIFRRRTVHENLLLGGYALGLRRRTLSARCDEVYERFPMLRGRASTTAGSLSGGQQQMLAIAQALLARPEVLMLDEPSAGLAPTVVKDVFDTVVELSRDGLGVLLVEQAVEDAMQVADHVTVLDVGRVVVSGAAGEAGDASIIRDAYLGRLS